MLVGWIVEVFDYVGVLILEFFVGVDGLVFNEMVLCVYNSGYWMIEGVIIF